MTGWTTPTLAATALVLAGALGLELAGAPQDDPPPPALIETSASPAPSLPPLPVADWAAAVLLHPLFDPTRNPPPGPADTPLPRLTAVITTPDRRLAIFQPAEGQSVSVSEGGSLGGYAVQSISTRQVILEGPKGQAIIGFPPPGR